MGIRVWPVVEGRDKYHYYAGLVEWKWLADCVSCGVLWAVADQLGLTPLHRLQSSSRADIVAIMGLEEVEEIEAAAERGADGLWYLEGQLLWSAEREWFAPQVGLATVRGLLNWIAAHPQVPNALDLSAVKPSEIGESEYNAEWFAYVLRALEAILIVAEKAKQRFYLACDI